MRIGQSTSINRGANVVPLNLDMNGIPIISPQRKRLLAEQSPILPGFPSPEPDIAAKRRVDGNSTEIFEILYTEGDFQ